MSFIQANTNKYTVKQMCSALKFPRSTYYAAIQQIPSRREQEYNIMKKLLAMILTIGMIFTLASCGGDKTENGGQQAGGAKKIDYANMTEDDLIKEFIKDEKNITLDEFIDLVSTYSYATINNKLELDENITDKAIKKLKDNKATLPAAKEIVEPLLKSDSPQVRGYAFSNIATFFGASDSHKAAAKEILKNEKDPYVIKCAVRALGNEGGKDAEIGKFLLSAAKNENAVVRRQAAVALGSTWNKTLDGAVDAEIELMKDSDNEVRKAAYRATIDYFKTTPGSDKVPAWAAVTSFTNKSEKNYAAWKEKATYFNTDELYEVMLGLVKNENLGRMTRGYACKPVAAHCTKEQFNAFGTVVNALTDKNAKFIQDEYQKQAAKLDE